MITYGSKSKSTLQPAKETASAWDAFRAKAKVMAVTSVATTAVAAEKQAISASNSDDEQETTPRASLKTIRIGPGFKGKRDRVDRVASTVEPSITKQQQLNPKARKEKSKQNGSRGEGSDHVKASTSFAPSQQLPSQGAPKAKTASQSDQKPGQPATTVNERKRKSGEDIHVSNRNDSPAATSSIVFSKPPPPLINRSDFHQMVLETAEVMMATEEDDDDEGSTPDGANDHLASLASSNSSSIFDIFLQSPVKAVKKARRVGRMERLPTSSPNAESPKKITNSRMLPPQYEFKETAANHYSQDQSSPSGKKSDTEISPTKREKERLLLSRPATTITYGRQEGTFAAKLVASSVSTTTTTTNPSPFSKATTADASLATSDAVASAPAALEDLMQSLDADSTVQIDEGLESSDDEVPKIQGFHELRAAGNSKRVLDELTYLFEGVFSPEVRIKRSSCFDLIRKLKKESILNSIRIHGKVKDVFTGLKSCEDAIVRTSLCFILCILGVKNMQSIVNQEMVNWLFKTLSKTLSDDVLIKIPKKKYEKSLVLDLKDLIKSYPRFAVYAATTNPLIVLIASVLQFSSSLVIQETLADHVVTFLKNEALKGSPSDFLASSAELEVEVEEKFISVPTACLTILERLSLNQSQCHPLLEDDLFQGQFATLFFSSLSDMMASSTPAKLFDWHKVNQVQHMLGLLINLTGPKRKLTISFTDTQILALFKGLLDLEKIIDEEVKLAGGDKVSVEKWIDVQSLILVLLINICGTDGSSAPVLIANYEQCGKTGLEWTATIYDSIFVQASEAVYATNKFRCSYMAVFLSILVKNGPASVRSALESHLACSSFESVLLTLKEFLSLHQAVQDEEGTQEEIVVLLLNLVGLLS